MINWVQLLTNNHIPFVTKGPNVAKGAIAIKCPYCGAADPSHHLNIKLVGKGWWCWRNKQHSGRSPTRLLQTLLHCSYEQAAQLAGDSTEIANDFLAQIRKLAGHEETPSPPKFKLKLSPDFRRFQDLPSARIFYNYLEERGFTKNQIEWAAKKFDLRYCTRGPYKGRIIFPIKYEGRLVSWTGRTVYEVEQRRYKVLSHEPEKAEREGFIAALSPNTDYLLWYDELQRTSSNTICMCEGPFDALRLWVLGFPATCFFTASPTIAQIKLLHKLLPRFKRHYLILDSGTTAKAMHVKGAMPSLGIRTIQLPAKIKDPGEIKSADQFRSFLP